MGDKKFTFIELHLDGDTQFGPKTISDALPVGDEAAATEAEADGDEEAAAAADEDEEGGRGAVGAVVGLLALVGLALALRKLRGGDEDEELSEEYEEPDVVVS
ncbi:hypothetical protein [Salinilacihabitans rarus]|uniref:hypothetical protein n=1 Tax=Salinilacihabitans rarus TaxID=2961596 RepID=UPI0020C86415|nr:hypothetical protein [Salinilacihabitans rarus]